MHVAMNLCNINIKPTLLIEVCTLYKIVKLLSFFHFGSLQVLNLYVHPHLRNRIILMVRNQF